MDLLFLKLLISRLIITHFGTPRMCQIVLFFFFQILAFVTFGNIIKLHLLIGLPICKGQKLSRSSCKIRQSCKEWMFLYRTIVSRRTGDLKTWHYPVSHLRTGPKKYPWCSPGPSQPVIKWSGGGFPRVPKAREGESTRRDMLSSGG